MANKNQKPGNEDWSWFIIVLALIGIFPLGLLLLFDKLFGSDEKKPGQQAPPLRGEAASSSPGQAASKSSRAAASAAASGAARPRQKSKAVKAVKRVTKSPVPKKSSAFFLEFFGILLLLFGVGGAIHTLGWALLWEFEVRFWLPDLLRNLGAGIAGGVMLSGGVSMNRQIKRFSRYLLVMGDREAVAIDELARTLGCSARRVEKDLEKMIDKGYFGGKAYLNMELGYLFRSSGAGAEFRRKFEADAQARAGEPAAPPPPKETEEGYSGILRSIRRANDRIADPALSAKIARLEDITAKIFRAVEEDPKKAGRIDTFLNYYLPTTQKLLDSYASFEAAGVEGENLRQAKQRIESTMDSIVKGFEYQLDELYKADVMDVDSDIRVMEHMLRRDTGSAEQDFGLDGSAVQTAPEDE